MVDLKYYQEPEYQINKNKGIIIGKDEKMLDLFNFVNILSNKPTTVLLTGETGTGKELFARALHYNGNGERKKKNFVTVNCAGIPGELLEADLFGSVKGSFTGAFKDSIGKFQHANGGTILLDEIGDMPSQLQPKILRAIQEKEITKIGSNTPEKVDARIIASTNRDLSKMIEEKTFRADLFYRLNVASIEIPSLKERISDVPLIAEHLVKIYNKRDNSNLYLSEEAKKVMETLPWKGNVRELENILERIFLTQEKGLIYGNQISPGSNKKNKIKTFFHSIPFIGRRSKIEKEEFFIDENEPVDKRIEKVKEEIAEVDKRMENRKNGKKSEYTIENPLELYNELCHQEGHQLTISELRQKDNKYANFLAKMRTQYDLDLSIIPRGKPGRKTIDKVVESENTSEELSSEKITTKRAGKRPNYDTKEPLNLYHKLSEQEGHELTLAEVRKIDSKYANFLQNRKSKHGLDLGFIPKGKPGKRRKTHSTETKRKKTGGKKSKYNVENPLELYHQFSQEKGHNLTMPELKNIDEKYAKFLVNRKYQYGLDLDIIPKAKPKKRKKASHKEPKINSKRGRKSPYDTENPLELYHRFSEEKGNHLTMPELNEIDSKYAKFLTNRKYNHGLDLSIIPKKR